MKDFIETSLCCIIRHSIQTAIGHIEEFDMVGSVDKVPVGGRQGGDVLTVAWDKAVRGMMDHHISSPCLPHPNVTFLVLRRNDSLHFKNSKKPLLQYVGQEWNP